MDQPPDQSIGQPADQPTARRVLVHGLVQGVGFRWHARRKAEELGLSGWVRNRPDGAVECLIEGAEASVEAMLAWLGRGPPPAQVERLEVGPAPPSGAPGFTVVR
jgi:acylphosphatase